MGAVEWLTGFGDAVVAFRNGPVTVIANTGKVPVELPVGEIVLFSGEVDGLSLPADTTVWMLNAS
jgi:alpha-glucosidase